MSIAFDCRTLQSLNRADRRRAAKVRSREVTFTDLDYEPIAPPRRSSTRIGRPTLILGIQTNQRPYRCGCPSCGGKRLPRHAYCAENNCDRSGVDGLLPNVIRSEGIRSHQAGSLKGGLA